LKDIPWVFEQSFGLEKTLIAVALATVVTPMNPSIYVKPIRYRISAVAAIFRPFDRPENRPHTPAWLVT
jgi:hypothetical protein